MSSEFQLEKYLYSDQKREYHCQSDTYQISQNLLVYLKNTLGQHKKKNKKKKKLKRK